MSDGPQPLSPAPGDSSIHQPLPYIVRLRVVTSEDAPPREMELRITAYSLMEAALQAIFEAGGRGTEDEKIKVEGIQPDVQKFWADLAQRTAAALKPARGGL